MGEPHLNGNGRNALIVRWVAALGIGGLSYTDLKLELAAQERAAAAIVADKDKEFAVWKATIDYRIENELVKHDQMRRWANKMARENGANVEVPEF